MAEIGIGELTLRAARIDGTLKEIYPETTALRYTSPFSLLVAAVLAAQCTDERVNMVTETLFDRYPTPAAFAGADLSTLEKDVHSTGFYRQKAQTLIKLCRALADRHGGRVPGRMDELTALPGIGRKTANLVLGNAMGVPSIFVDTHVKRISFRLGLTENTDPDRIEADLLEVVEPSRRTAFSNLLTHLGRHCCKARKPDCPRCAVRGLCPKKGLGG